MKNEVFIVLKIYIILYREKCARLKYELSALHAYYTYEDKR